MEVSNNNQNRLGLDSAQQSATLPKATDQSILPHSMLGKALAASKVTIQPDMAKVNELIQPCKEAVRKDAYDAYWVGFRAEQTSIANMRRVQNEIDKAKNDIDMRSQLQQALPQGYVEMKSNDYVKVNGVSPVAWYSGLDGRPPVVKPTAPFQDVDKPVEKKKEKGSAILGYLRRKALASRTAIKKATARRVIKSAPQTEKSGVSQEVIIPTSNRFGLVEDEVVDMEIDETPAGDDQVTPSTPESGEQVTPSTSKRKRGSESEVSRELGEPNGFEVTEDDFETIETPSFKLARCLRDKKTRSIYTRLTYYLKCKHFMHSKDPHHIRTLVQDARAWLQKAKCSMENHTEYTLLTSAVSAAFFVDQEELNFRARMKNRREWQAILKHNAVSAGDLGWRFGQVEPRLSGLRHALMSRVRLPITPISA